MHVFFTIKSALSASLLRTLHTTHCTLSTAQAEQTHSGLYKCAAANVLGKAEASGDTNTVTQEL